MRSLPRLALTVLGAFLLTDPACSQPRLVSSSVPVELGAGATFVVKKVAGAKEFELKLVFFDVTQCAMKVAVNHERKGARKLEEAGREAKAIAVCNGGYFTPRFAPSGLEIAEGVRTGEYDHKNLPQGGALAVSESGARILRDDEFTDGAGITDLVQCCPRLIEGGAAMPLGGEERAPRTFLLTDNAGRWALGASNGIGLQELADILAMPGVITEFKVQRALNLDGGPSTGLWCQEAGGSEHYQREAWPVRNMILLTARKK